VTVFYENQTQLVNSLWEKCKYSLHYTFTGVRHCYLVEVSK